MIAYEQWNKLKKYANKKGIKIIADCPFYVGIDSTECWLNKEQFHLNENFEPTIVSGCPPDAFSDDGQLWGTPIYDFEKMKKTNYELLVHRIGHLASICDILRLDHFRAFDTYCVIPGKDENARRGEWKIGPRNEFFDELYKHYPNINLIVEDLGELFDSVRTLRDHYKLPGMYVIQFNIFDINQNSNYNQIVYSGTHDNQTLKGWLKSLPEANKEFLKDRFNTSNVLKALYSYIYNLPSLITIFPLQDLLALDDKARLNSPGTMGSPNWEWKLKDMSFTKLLKFSN